jgi:hypothetical protein
MAYSTLVEVGLHGICTEPNEPLREESWLGAYPGEVALLVEHLRKAVQITAASETALLVLSGADTHRDTSQSEGESCIAVCAHQDWWGTNVGSRAFAEKSARDSLGNSFFSLALFYELADAWPNAVIGVGWAMKEARHRKHAADIGLPNFSYVAVNDPPAESLPRALAGEKQKFQDLQIDPYLRGERYRKQRQRRNPRQRPVPHLAHPALNELARFLYGGDLFAVPTQWT